jgi:hypothetical protein
MQFKIASIAATSLLLTITNANFHIYNVVQITGNGGLRAVKIVPDYDMSCGNVVKSNEADNIDELREQASFGFSRGVCGSGALDFYRETNDGIYTWFYRGDPQERGRCYPTSGFEDCICGLGICQTYQKLWCNGYC